MSAKPKKQARCPRCAKHFFFTKVADHPPFPFCSDRCRDVDLGNWLTGQYVIPGSEVSKEDQDAMAGGDEDAEDGT